MPELPKQKFGEVCQFVRGPFGGSLKKSMFVPEGFAVYEQQHAIYDQFSQFRYFVDEEKFRDMKRFEVNPGDLIMSCSGTMGKTAIIPQGARRGIINQALLKLTPSENLDVEFLKYWMDSPGFIDQISKFSKGAAIQNIASVKVLKEIQVPNPPLSEQKSIVAILNEAFEAIDQAKANIERNIQNAEELFQARNKEMFANKGEGWIDSTIGELCDLRTGGTPSKKRKEYFEGGEIPWLVSGDIHRKEIKDCQGRITQLGYDNSSAKLLPIGSVMIALNGQGKTRGTVALLGMEATCNQSLVSINPRDKREFSSKFLFANLDSRYNEIRKITGDSGKDRRGLNMPLIRKIEISFPGSVQEQDKLAKKSFALAERKENYLSQQNEKRALLEKLKKSFLQKAFQGELNSKELVA